MKFQEITNKQWNMVESHLPPPAKTGRPRADDRTTINAIMFVLITGCRWIDLLQGMVVNHLHTGDSKIFNKNEYGKRFSNVQLHQHTNKTR